MSCVYNGGGDGGNQFPDCSKVNCPQVHRFENIIDVQFSDLCRNQSAVNQDTLKWTIVAVVVENVLLELVKNAQILELGQEHLNALQDQFVNLLSLSQKIAFGRMVSALVSLIIKISV